MLHENEVVMLLFGLVIFLFIAFNKVHIRRIYAWRILLASYSLLLIGWLLTILEGYFFESFLNFLEHLCYAFSAVVLAVWCFRLFRDNRKEGLP